jgi:hypothetical protein
MIINKVITEFNSYEAHDGHIKELDEIYRMICGIVSETMYIPLFQDKDDFNFTSPFVALFLMKIDEKN